MPSDLKSFETLRIQLKKPVGQEPMYRLANIADTDKSFTISSPKFRLITRTDNVECPSKGCITELSAAQPKSQSSILYLTNIIGKMIPPGFQHIESSTRLYCAIVAGDCGATVPIYRYYKFLPNGLYHAYSTNEDIEIAGYVREPQPLCYGWQTLTTEQLRAEGLEGSGEEEDFSSEEKVQVTDEEKEEEKKEEFKMMREVCDDKTPPKPSSMKSLNVYVNDKTGALKDHYYTTKVPTPEEQKNSENEFYGYKIDEVCF
uniref:Uncharacterized protein n=1 Tax=Panagrolaimus davidi TaxID=227884 RepID=A0A914QZW6_9BILA